MRSLANSLPPTAPSLGSDAPPGPEFAGPHVYAEFQPILALPLSLGVWRSCCPHGVMPWKINKFEWADVRLKGMAQYIGHRQLASGIGIYLLLHTIRRTLPL